MLLVHVLIAGASFFKDHLLLNFVCNFFLLHLFIVSVCVHSKHTAAMAAYEAQRTTCVSLFSYYVGPRNQVHNLIQVPFPPKPSILLVVLKCFLFDYQYLASRAGPMSPMHI